MEFGLKCHYKIPTNGVEYIKYREMSSQHFTDLLSNKRKWKEMFLKKWSLCVYVFACAFSKHISPKTTEHSSRRVKEKKGSLHPRQNIVFSRTIRETMKQWLELTFLDSSLLKISHFFLFGRYKSIKEAAKSIEVYVMRRKVSV